MSSTAPRSAVEVATIVCLLSSAIATALKKPLFFVSVKFSIH
jgi:hypothetical protein